MVFRMYLLLLFGTTAATEQNHNNTNPVDISGAVERSCITPEVWAHCNFPTSASKPGYGVLPTVADGPTLTVESSNWPSAEIVGSVAHILLRDALGYAVERAYRSDYLDPHVLPSLLTRTLTLQHTLTRARMITATGMPVQPTATSP